MPPADAYSNLTNAARPASPDRRSHPAAHGRPIYRQAAAAAGAPFAAEALRRSHALRAIALAIALRADPLHGAFLDRHFLLARDFHQMANLVDAAPTVPIAATLAVIIAAAIAGFAAARTLAGTIAVAVLVAAACDARNADGFAFARILIRGHLFRGPINVAYANEFAAAMRTAVAARLAPGFAAARCVVRHRCRGGLP